MCRDHILVMRFLYGPHIWVFTGLRYYLGPGISDMWPRLVVGIFHDFLGMIHMICRLFIFFHDIFTLYIN